MGYRIFTLSPGSTSTKCAIFEDGKLLFKTNIVHPKEELDRFATVNDQRPYRVAEIRRVVNENGYRLRDMDAYAAYSGGLESTPSGVYPVNEKMLEDSLSGRIAEHPAMLGAQIIHEFAEVLGNPAFVINPPDCDEFIDVARLSGIKGIYRESHVHVLNQKEVATRAAIIRGRAYEDCNFIVCHIGGGLSVAAHRKGRMIDGNDVLNGEGPMAPNRSGYVPLLPLVKRCCDGTWDYKTAKKVIAKAGGLKSLTGTDDLLEIKERRSRGDKWCELVYDSFAYNLAKYIGSYACVLEGDVDAILLTGGVSKDEEFVELIRKYAGWIAPVMSFGGDFEMEALGWGATDALKGKIELKEYTGVPVWSGFDFEPETV